MVYNEYKTFNLYKSPPQVLLLGNGLTRCSKSAISWQDMLESICCENIDKTDIERIKNRSVPYTIRATALSHTDDKARHEKYKNALEGIRYEESDLMKQLLAIPFDAVLTTNYTYEAEYSLLPKYPKLSNTAKLNYCYDTLKEGDRTNTKYLINIFNRLESDGTVRDIWHIHGEVRRTSSLIFTHDEYARLIERVLAYNKKRGKEYGDYKDEVHFKSWIDYFILGDLYILGQGLDYSEFDLWWLLNRRMRERNANPGKAVFYSVDDEESPVKAAVLKGLNVEHRSFQTVVKKGSSDADALYREFYLKAINDIKENVTGRH